MNVDFLLAGSKIICKDASDLWGSSKITEGNVYSLVHDYRNTGDIADDIVLLLDDNGVLYGFSSSRFVVYEGSQFEQHMSDIEQNRKNANWGIF